MESPPPSLFGFQNTPLVVASYRVATRLTPDPLHASLPRQVCGAYTVNHDQNRPITEAITTIDPMATHMDARFFITSSPS